MKVVRNAIPIACAVALFACKEDKPAQTSGTGASSERSAASSNTAGTSTTTLYGGAVEVEAMPLRYEEASLRITGARCDHVVACEQIGADKRFTTHETCKQDQGKKTQDEMKSTDCANGFDASKLSICLAAIAQQDCSSLVLSLQNVDACKTSALCIASPTP